MILTLTTLGVGWTATAHASAVAAPTSPDAASTHPAPPTLADVQLEKVSIHDALQLLADIYDLSIATGPLPDRHVSARLRDVDAQQALAAVAAAADVQLQLQDTVILVTPRTPSQVHRQLIAAAPALGESAWLTRRGITLHDAGDGHVWLEGPEGAVQAAAQALQQSRRQRLEDRVYELGAASGDEVSAVLKPVLEADLESFVYDEARHRLTVSALPATLRRVDPLLERLTAPPTQYEIEVRVVEVSRHALERLGAQGSVGLDVRGGVLASTFPLAGLDDATRYLPSFRDLADLANNSGGGTPLPDGEAPFRFGRIDARGVGLLIELLQESGEARVMATPKVTALDNHPARISMVTTLRIPTFTQNQAFATTTVSGIEVVDVGTVLDVRPRKMADGDILLRVAPEVSELESTPSLFSNDGLTQGLPVITRRRTETDVLLASGETLVIGGLVTEHEVRSEGKTPGLGDIPWIGRAFRLKRENVDSSELLVFVTPRQLPPTEVRRTHRRVDDLWLPSPVAATLSDAREALKRGPIARRLDAIQALEAIDASLQQQGLDVADELLALGLKDERSTQRAVAGFLLRRRPGIALAVLQQFSNPSRTLLDALDRDMAPHLRLAIAESLLQEPDGVSWLQPRLPTIHGTPSMDAGRWIEAALEVHRRTPLLEPALAWSGAADLLEITGAEADRITAHRALGVLGHKAPDLRHLVSVAFRQLQAGGPGPSVDPSRRIGVLGGPSFDDLDPDEVPQRLALQMVRLATITLACRVLGLSPADPKTLDMAVRQEVAALQRLTGASSPPSQQEVLVRHVLDRWPDAAGRASDVH